jgi:hypothetical protein
MSAMSELDLQIREAECPACEYRAIFGEEGIFQHRCMAEIAALVPEPAAA